jgi:antitoxin VapB
MIRLPEDIQALARRLADAQGLSIGEAIRRALEERARAVGLAARPRDQSRETVAARRARIDRIVKEIAAMPVLDPRSPVQIMDDLNAP